MSEIEEMVTVLKAACDRDWKDETPIQVANVAANAIYWRDREIARLREELSSVAADVAQTLADLRALRG